MRFLLPAALAVALMITGPSYAGNGTSAVLGQGYLSCGNWTAWRRENLALGPEQWVLGFLSGTGNMGGPLGIDPLNEVDAEGVWGWVDNYCRSHPLEKIAVAAVAFSHEHPH
jgi:hypothetical protein